MSTIDFHLSGRLAGARARPTIQLAGRDRSFTPGTAYKVLCSASDTYDASMKTMAAQLAIAITTLALQYGVPLAIDLAKTWKDDLGDREPTKKDWETLRAMVP